MRTMKFSGGNGHIEICCPFILFFGVESIRDWLDMIIAEKVRTTFEIKDFADDWLLK